MDVFSGKRLVVFGCGYVGAAVARWATERGARVTALTRNEGTAVALRTEGVEVVVADLAGEAWHGAVEPGPEWAVDCVGAGGGGVEEYRRSYVGGMASILAWGRSRGRMGTLVYTSSTSVYAQGGGVRVDESMPAEGATERARILIEAEERLIEDRVAWERAFVLRLAGIYGPGRGRLIEQVRAGEMTGGPGRRLNLIHRDDAVAAVGACLTAPVVEPGGIFNVADDGEATRGEIAEWLAARLGVAAPRFTGEAGRREAAPDRIVANERLKARLGWRPGFPTFREGLGSLLSR